MSSSSTPPVSLLDQQPVRDSLRWAGSFVLVVAVHAAAAAMVLDRGGLVPVPPSVLPAVILLDLEPLPSVPEATASEAPPGPELSEVIPEPEPPPPVEMPPPVMAEVTLPDPEPLPPLELKPPPPRKSIEKKVERKPPQPQKTAPPAAPQPTQAAAAPVAGTSVEPPSPALPTWRGILQRHLERHKRYPPAEQRARHEGVSYVRFTMSRDGHVLSSHIERPSGFASLDQEGLDLLQRAQPLPPLPHDQPGESLEIIVPVQFFVKR